MFDKTTYWKRKRAIAAMKPEERRELRRIFNKQTLVAVHYEVDWPHKPVSKKALLKNTKRARKELAYEQS